jgi:3-phenylpropionate/trans-cinnamate dioxygenase ferredoxin subunit
MAEFETVGPAEDVDEGEMKVYKVKTEDVGVARVEGLLYAFSDTCTHMGCTMNPDDLDGNELTCECHGSMYDVTNGEVLNGPSTEAIATFEVREEGGDIQVSL